ncbi:hypothetical protein SAMN05421810_107198 [Amycolatopsis arida]|uniref:PPE family protein n=1 Tax=Amycolatopsis arida TaxID=587909 RepID=A0A1I5YJ17_9PSEU|nr:hypothetical protein [Amycolatopsis arida]TDX90551.1 hypothetical protein CLV69_107198 [Amycolatopsis arida]SFQ44199.1 hypothetical protein SAMN05421810_107198 [Amycolatopsis arida]
MTTENPTAPRELSDREIAELSPADREQYFRDRAAAGVDDGGLFGWFQRMQAQAEGERQAQEQSERNVRTLSSGDVQYVEGLRPSDADYQGHEHAQLTQYVTQNLEPGQVVEVSEAYHELHKAFNDFATQLKAAIAKSESEWEGPAAEDARGYFTSLQTWADANSTNAKLASETMYQQSEAATSAKNRMPEEIPFSWDTEMRKWASNPLDVIDNVNQSIETYRASQQAHAEAASVMTQYDNDLYAAASKQPVFAEPPKFGEGGGGAVTPPAGYGTGTGNTGASGFAGGTPGSSAPPSAIPGGGAAGGGGGTPGGGGGFTPMPAPLGRGPSTGSGAVPPARTRPSGYQPPATSMPRGSGGAPPSTMGGMGPVPVGMGGMGGLGGGSDYSSKIGRGGGGFGPGGSGAAGGAPGSGAASGAARPGGVGAAEAAAGRAGAAGRGMGGGMGAMGAGGGRGQGGEDKEHQRPTYLVEGDPDELFGTDQRTAPPVIGE